MHTLVRIDVQLKDIVFFDFQRISDAETFLHELKYFFDTLDDVQESTLSAILTIPEAGVISEVLSNLRVMNTNADGTEDLFLFYQLLQ